MKKFFVFSTLFALGNILGFSQAAAQQVATFEVRPIAEVSPLLSVAWGDLRVENGTAVGSGEGTYDITVVTPKDRTPRMTIRCSSPLPAGVKVFARAESPTGGVGEEVEIQEAPAILLRNIGSCAIKGKKIFFRVTEEGGSGAIRGVPASFILELILNPGT